METFIIVVLVISIITLFLMFLKVNRKNETISNEIKNNAQKANNAIDGLLANDQVLQQNIRSLKSINTELEQKNNELEQQVNRLSKELSLSITEIAALKKKIAVFAEIDEDSRRLNVIDEPSSLFAPAPLTIDTQGDNAESLPQKSESKELDDEQEKALRFISQGIPNVFITGKAGTGKSYLLRSFVKQMSKDESILVLAPTGIAALNAKGATIHSAFGYSNLVSQPLEELKKGKIHLNKSKIQVLKNTSTIFIDEISMVRSDTFERMNLILQAIMKNEEAFGGKQMVLFGDLFQLPPVTKSQEEIYLKKEYGGKYFFDAPAYKNGKFHFIELTKNHRQQGDYEFYNILNGIREGSITKKDLQILNARTNFSEDDIRRVIQLFPTKAKAESINKKELSNIEAKLYTYEAQVLYIADDKKTEDIEKAFVLSKSLELKKGALVMFVANDSEQHRWVNGTLGIVSDLQETCIQVTVNGKQYNILPECFEEQEATYKNGKITYETVLKVKQYPIILAYAITIHKSQGMTYQRVACNIDKCFEPGQAYVALSRCTSLNSLYLLSEVDESILDVDQNIQKFYLEMKSGTKAIESNDK